MTRSSSLLLALVAAGLLSGCLGPRPPRELEQVRTVTDELLRANRLRTSPLRFTLEVGETAPYWAEKEGVCRAVKAAGDSESDCASWAHHAPGAASGEAQRRVERLAYLLGTANAHSYSHGVIGFDRSYFLVHEDDPAALRCVVAHELVHVLRRHAYLSDRAGRETWRTLPEPQRQRQLAALSQQQELAADRGAMLMTAIAGHDPAACLAELQNSAELDADYAEEDPLGTHPGHARRMAAGRAYLAGPLRRDLARWRRRQPSAGSVQPRWRWDGDLQVLSVTTR